MSGSEKELKELREEKAWGRIDEAVVESEHFLEKYYKQILMVVGVAVVAVCAYLAYDYFLATPKEKAAQVAIFKGEEYFRNGMDSLALHGDANGYIGFEGIINEYGSTKPGKLAKLYAGISYARLDNVDKALSYLKDYKGDDKIVSHLVDGAIGDCLVKQGKSEEAVSHFIKAAKAVDNVVQSPILYKKAGEIYRDLGQHDKVIEVFTIIKNSYGNSPIALEATKYIEEAEVLKKK